MSERPVVLTIGALYVGGGEGIVADAAVVEELDARCACVVTAVVTAAGAEPTPIPAPLLAAQLRGAAACPPRATRVGEIVSEGEAREIAAVLGALAPDAIVLAPELAAAFRADLLPLATLAILRAGDLRELEGVRDLAERVREQGARAVLVAGASIRGRVTDLLDDGGRVTVLQTSRIQAPRVPGLAGAHATALTTHLARGESLVRAAEAAQRYVGLRLRRLR